jgi:hypothetical protein
VAEKLLNKDYIIKLNYNNFYRGNKFGIILNNNLQVFEPTSVGISQPHYELFNYKCSPD